jgi:hypothetical protein
MAPSENSSPKAVIESRFWPPQTRTWLPVQAMKASERGASGEVAMRRHRSPAGS